MQFRAGAVVLGLLLALASTATAQNIEMGPTYELLDRQATRVTTEFVDAQVVTERSQDGTLESTLYSPAGAALGHLRTRPAARRAEVRLPATGGRSTGIPVPPVQSLTTDWANLQLYALWKDVRWTGSPSLLEEQLILEEGLARLEARSGMALSGRRGTSGRVEQLRQQERAVTTEFGDLVARARRSDGPAAAAAAAETFTATYSSYLVNRRTGRTLGLARYFDEAKVFVWDLGPLSSGFVSDETVPGGWTFEHNMAWSNVQLYSFWYFHQDRLEALDTSLDGSGSACAADVSEATTSSGPLPAGPPGGSNLLAPKNEPGCDLLHWLDDTVYRECCDQHDECYGYDPQSNEQTADDPCTFWSWFFVEGWRCMRCNLDVLLCFLTTTFDGPGGGGGGGGGGGDPCTVSGAGWCPAECFSCDRQAY